MVTITLNIPLILTVVLAYYVVCYATLVGSLLYLNHIKPPEVKHTKETIRSQLVTFLLTAPLAPFVLWQERGQFARWKAYNRTNAS